MGLQRSGGLRNNSTLLAGFAGVTVNVGRAKVFWPVTALERSWLDVFHMPRLAFCYFAFTEMADATMVAEDYGAL